MTDSLLYDKDPATHVAHVTFNRPDRRNALVRDMYEGMHLALADAEQDDTIKVVVLRGAGGCFTSGQDMDLVYSWYEGSRVQGDPAREAGDGRSSATTPPAPEPERKRRPSQRRRLAYDRWAQSFYHELYKHNKVLIAQVEKYALGGGLEFALSCDLAVCGRSTRLGMPAARFLGPVLGNLHLFFHRLGPTFAKDLLLTGRVAGASEFEQRGIFTRFTDDADVAETVEDLAAMVARMPADGIAIAKEFFRLVEESQGMAGADVTEHIAHAFATNLSFEDDEFNFVKLRSRVGTSKAFELRDAYFERGEPLPGVSHPGDDLEKR
ncbi:MAG: enoyl-CoA hydratase/isomerase family protein [Actinobacteria bacterium ATB1]|nr:enoyl-CoA hydratase/isomerase family protein [Actinobacteria bacterium ATB1]